MALRHQIVTAEGSSIPTGIVSKWRRLLSRMAERLVWHACGVRLWLLRRPYLRFLPFPYPTVSSVAQWKLQAESMVVNKALAQRHFERALKSQAFTMGNLGECGWLRNRLGTKLSFLEDPILVGMLAARSQKGMTLRIKKEVQQEALKEAAAVRAKGEHMEAARELIGPRGGLPTLRRDLVRLAALLNVPIKEKATVEEIKAAVRPMVQTLKGVRGQEREEPQAPQTPPKASQGRMPKSPPTSPLPIAYSPGTASSGSMEVMTEVSRMMAAQEERFQGMMNQVLQHVMTMASQSMEGGLGAGMTEKDELMTEMDYANQQKRKQGTEAEDFTPDEIAQMNAEAYRANDPETYAINDHQTLLDIQGLSGQHVEPELSFKLKDKVKPAQQQLISQAWERHLADKKRVSMTKQQLSRILESDWKSEMETYMNEVFVTAVEFPASKRLVTEVFTTSQRVHEAAHSRGHMTGTPVSLETGYDLTKKKDQDRALRQLDQEDPYFLVLAFPCGFWSPLMNLNGPKDFEQRRKVALTLVKFAFKMAERQIARGRHVVLENPKGSRAWKLPWVRMMLRKLGLKLVGFDQCRYGLRSVRGFLHKKPTYFATSSQAVHSRFVDKKCKRNHVHDLVFGGQKTTRRAGLYTLPMARAMVKAMEEQFEMDGQREVEVLVQEAMTAGDDVDVGPEAQDETAADGSAVEFIYEDSESDVEVPNEDEVKIPAAVKLAVKRIHESTGHRSNKRLARALAISGAPPEVILAAKHLKCDVCAERRQPKTRRPASLPVPKDTSDQCHIDLFVVEDAADRSYVVCHITDFTSRYQMAGILQSKATAEVVSFLKQYWLPLMGPPRVLVADHGREFVSNEFESFCAGLGIYVFYAGIGAPWQNGIAERSGGVLKALLGAIVTAHSVIGEREMKDALGEAVMSYNCDVNDSGHSPIQVVTGRQPRMHGDVLGGIQQRLSEHSLISASPSMARTLAMRETARLAMVRLHFSRGLRRAELSRSRNPTMHDLPSPGEIAYFYRFQKYQGKNHAKKVLALRKWHGPALLLAIEGSSIAFVSYKGQLHRCALEHIRRASSLEQISAGSWHDAIAEVIEQALRDQVGKVESKNERLLDKQTQPDVGGQGVREEAPKPEETAGGDLPPVEPAEVVAAVQPLEGPADGGGEFSRRSSLLSGSGAKLRSRSPVPMAVRRLMKPVIERAREVDERSASTKRVAEAPVDDLRQDAEAEPSGGAVLESGASVDPLQEALTLTREDVVDMAFQRNASAHPLIQVQALAAFDRAHPEQAVVRDHGSWDGRWPLPMQTEWQVREKLGMKWPCGIGEFDVEAVEAARKELLWSQMKPNEKEEFRKAAQKGWSVYADNGAVEILDRESSQKILRGMTKEEQQGADMLQDIATFVAVIGRQLLCGWMASYVMRHKERFHER